MNRAQAPVLKDLVLVGGGHSHVAVLKSFGMRPQPGVRVTLVSKDSMTPYSGMLPGLIAGHYTYEQAHIDLRPLCRFAGAQFYQAAVTGMDLENKRLLCAGRPPVSFDVLSINTGSTPRARDVPGAAKYALPVKPIDRFLEGWQRLIERVAALDAKPFRLVVVGGGAGGVELLLSVRQRLLTTLKGRGLANDSIHFALVTASETILPTHNHGVQRRFLRVLRERGVQIHTNHTVVEARPDAVICAGGQVVPFDALLWVTDASAPPWIRESGLQTNEGGFIALNDCLQSVSHPFVFAAGDVAAVLNHPRPKSGVFAVRQGPPLSENLRRALAGEPLEPFKPQKEFLSLISTGDQYAVASRGPWAFEGAWVWTLKDWIDRRWMRKYQELPEMTAEAAPLPAAGAADADALRELTSTPMRCGGCGAKVGADVLSRVLRRLNPIRRDDVLVGLDTPDDAAVITVPPGRAAVQTVDFFRAFINDPCVFGRIAANHALGDIFAMGAEPQSALAVVTVPFGAEAKVEEQLYQALAGAVEVLNEHNTALIGGHTAEGPELAFGLTVNGLADTGRLLRKGGMRPGDALILAKPVGTGALFAADMRGKAKGHWIEAALASMLVSNRAAAECLLRHGATACTDVTGFGLLGHLVEMMKASGVDAEVRLNAVPLLEGALETVKAGIFSSLQPQNIRLRRAVANAEDAAKEARYPLLFDPQTAGGLLASVPADKADACMRDLRAAGYGNAAIIGAVKEQGEGPPMVRIVT